MKLKVDFCEYSSWLNEPVYALYIKRGRFWRKMKKSRYLKDLMDEMYEIIGCELGKEYKL